MSLGGFRYSSIHITLSSRVKNAFQRHQLPQTTVDLTSASSSSAFTSLPAQFSESFLNLRAIPLHAWPLPHSRYPLSEVRLGHVRRNAKET